MIETVIKVNLIELKLVHEVNQRRLDEKNLTNADQKWIHFKLIEIEIQISESEFNVDRMKWINVKFDC